MSKSVKQTYKNRQRHRRQVTQPAYKVGDYLILSSWFSGSTRTVPARVKRVSVTDSGIRDLQIVIYVLEVWNERGKASLVMTDTELKHRIRPAAHLAGSQRKGG